MFTIVRSGNPDIRFDKFNYAMAALNMAASTACYSISIYYRHKPVFTMFAPQISQLNTRDWINFHNKLIMPKLVFRSAVSVKQDGK